MSVESLGAALTLNIKNQSWNEHILQSETAKDQEGNHDLDMCDMKASEFLVKTTAA